MSRLGDWEEARPLRPPWLRHCLTLTLTLNPNSNINPNYTALRITLTIASDAISAACRV